MPRRHTDTDLAILSEKGLDAELPAPAPRKKRNNEESNAQRALIKWWHRCHDDYGIPECLLFSVPNGGGRSGPIVGSILKAEGLRAGAPDLLLLVARGGHYGLAIEMKTAIGVVTNEQAAFQAVLSIHGYRVKICRSCDEAVAVIEDYLMT
jgi:VRR-NUC domain